VPRSRSRKPIATKASRKSWADRACSPSRARRSARSPGLRASSVKSPSSMALSRVFEDQTRSPTWMIFSGVSSAMGLLRPRATGAVFRAPIIRGVSRLPRPDIHAFRLVLVGPALTSGPDKRQSAPGHLHVLESRPADLHEVLSLQESTSDSGGPDRDILPRGGRDVPMHHDIGNLQTAAGLQHAKRFREDPVLVGDQVDHTI